ncbi:helix-turn-helix domain-containing protein [Clostridioides sp. ZZV14-6044]|uniref:helix-turn-helix transcriptional regulator n=1 Tax=unclassified Clostridioides TaxID=2635829 RepID=UPI001D11E26F|nr:helix-turn-helix transcriptional regulator [Clostridioides sp. ZZV14-6104]MCC0742567.1 helix-turn-helix transcriptional regulator [Clostridioides sp. ZZV14-6044]MCC0749933.1 helix-turn-helix transcriptional regulator [Clostridioides sp. ZZV13-5731]
MKTNLLKFRLKNNKTRNEMSKLLEMQATYYAKIENERRNPSYNFLCKFKKAFPNKSIDDLFFNNKMD